MKKEVVKYVRDLCRDPANAFTEAFFNEHICMVVDYSRKLAEVMKADAEVVELAAYLHDMAAVRDFRVLATHAQKGAEEGRSFLKERGYDARRADRVAACILRHSSPIRAGEGLPEEVCVSNADAMAQIANPPYWFFFAYRIMGMGFVAGRNWYAEKVMANWAQLTDPARRIIEARYRLTEALLSACEDEVLSGID